ncbi:MAG: hypothetical protein ACLPJY_17680, partial [Rhodomicrobium sp.]
MKVDIPAGLPDKTGSGSIPVIRATPGFFSGYVRAKSAQWRRRRVRLKTIEDSMYAVIRTGGKQYKVAPQDVLQI